MGIVKILNLIAASYKRNEPSMTVFTENTKIRPILDCLVSEGVIDNYLYFKKGKFSCLTVKLKYYRLRPAVIDLKPQKKTNKTYVQSRYRLLKKDHLGLKLKVVSTSQGIMTNTQAKAKGLGGKLICTVF